MLYIVVTVRMEIKRSGDSEILHEIVRDTERKSEKHEIIRVVSQTICVVSRNSHYASFPF